MNQVFADTYYWLALVHKRDPDHQRVHAYDANAFLVTSVPVQLEVMDALSGIQLRPAAIAFWNSCALLLNLEVIPISQDLLDRSAALFAARRDKAWSLTDCISFTIMQDRGIQLALTGDNHFIQAGFEIAFS